MGELTSYKKETVEDLVQDYVMHIVDILKTIPSICRQRLVRCNKYSSIRQVCSWRPEALRRVERGEEVKMMPKTCA